MSLKALKLRFNQFLHDNAKQIVSDAIGQVGIKKQTGNLLNSIEYMGEVAPGVFRTTIGVDYAEYLNRGYGPFTMWHGGIHPGWQATWFTEIAKQRMYEGIVETIDENFNFTEEV